LSRQSVDGGYRCILQAVCSDDETLIVQYTSAIAYSLWRHFVCWKSVHCRSANH